MTKAPNMASTDFSDDDGFGGVRPPRPAYSPRDLMRNALVFSASFAILEGCISATIIISHEVVEHHLASSVSAVLYLFFALGTLVAPALVRRAGVKRSLVASMLMYAVYTAAYMAPSPTVLYPAGALGGLAGALRGAARMPRRLP